jgi:hypothetical protein
VEGKKAHNHPCNMLMNRDESRAIAEKARKKREVIEEENRLTSRPNQDLCARFSSNLSTVEVKKLKARPKRDSEN